MMFCMVCNKRLFKMDPENVHTIRVKGKKRQEYIFHLKDKGTKIKDSFKPIKREGKYLFDHIASNQSVIGMRCYDCSALHVINLEEGTSTVVKRKY